MSGRNGLNGTGPTVAIRTNCNGTLGHLARMRHLALALRQRGHECVVLLDHDTAQLPAAWSESLALHGVYTADDGAVAIGESGDARLTLQRMRAWPIRLVVLDDTRFGAEWEAVVQAAGLPVMAVDDLARAHRCELLLEPGIACEPEEGARPEPALRLAGPRYLPLDPDLRAAAPDVARAGILLSLGGGGDLRRLARIADAILASRTDAAHTAPLLRIVIGAQATHANSVRTLAAAHPTRIQLLENVDSLAEPLRACALFIGAAGTALYELAACQVPAITFSISADQHNDMRQLERIGHPLHLDTLAPGEEPALARLVLRLLPQVDRLRALRAQASCRIDTGGAGRVAEVLDAYLQGGRSQAAEAVQHIDGASGERGRNVVTGLRMVACQDSDINAYLDARNLAGNRGNMTSDAPIDRLTHYAWWFASRRHSWRVELDGVAQLWIWHERRAIGDAHVLIGGWFVCREEPQLACVMAALTWQLRHTDLAEPGVPWAAVIRRGNRFVRALNERAGFRDAAPGSDEQRRIEQLFPEADASDFHHVVRDAA